MDRKQKMVQHFMRSMGQHARDKFDLTDYPYDLREKLITEEAKEFADACKEKDAVKMVDALCDLLYVVYGAGVAMGIDLDLPFDEVHRSNMLKLWEDGKPRFNEFGKVVKPPNWRPPNLGWMLDLLKHGDPQLERVLSSMTLTED